MRENYETPSDLIPHWVAEYKDGVDVGRMNVEIPVPGFEKMKKTHLTRALVLQSLIQLEIEFHFCNGDVPTRKAMLSRMIELGSNLTEGSISSITMHLTYLIDEGYAYRTYPLIKDANPSTKKAAGTRNYSIRSNAVQDWIASLLKKNRIKAQATNKKYK